MKPFLDAPIAELATWLDLDARTTLPDNVLGKCSGPLRGLAPDALVELLRQAARVRRERKATEISARARQVGWDGALWEGLLAALGYKHNAWSFRRLAELVPLSATAAETGNHRPPVPPDQIEAQFLGLAGLLPCEIPRGADPHLRTLWDYWWRERNDWAEFIVPKSMWRFSGIRPANRPERRLALAARWQSQADLPKKLAAWLESTVGQRPSDLAGGLLEVLLPADAEPAPFWSRHWTLRSMELSTPQPLLGMPRVTDLAINVIVPWLWARAGPGDERPELRTRVERCWEEWPGGEDNAVLKLTRQRLFGTTRPRLPGRAMVQQGLLQISRDFCDPAGALCQACRFPEWVTAR